MARRIGGGRARRRDIIKQPTPAVLKEAEGRVQASSDDSEYNAEFVATMDIDTEGIELQRLCLNTRPTV